MNAQETILEFYRESDTNEALRTALDAATGADQVVAVAREYGYEFTKDDMAALKERVAVLDEKEMGDISGGDPPGSPIVPLGYDGSSAFQSLSDSSRSRLLRGLQSHRSS